MIRKLLSLYLLLTQGCFAIVFAQNVTIKGQVVDANTNLPIAGVNVFISGTTIGTATNTKGHYILKDSIPTGQYSLAFSHIKYITDAQTVNIVKTQSLVINQFLIPKKNRLQEITISSTKDQIWKKQFTQFKKEFLGTSYAAKQCKILNPWVVEFTQDQDILKASARDELVIENPYLGYKVYCSLKSFQAQGNYASYIGYYRYKKLPPNNIKQAKRFNKRRHKAFYGSFRHFVCALIHNRVNKEGFTVYTTKEAPERTANMEVFEVKPDTLYTRDSAGIYLKIPHYLKVVYRRALEEQAYAKRRLDQLGSGIVPGLYEKQSQFQKTLLKIKGGTLRVSPSGLVLDDPFKVTSYWYWAWKRVGDMLPLDFFPNRLKTVFTLHQSKAQSIPTIAREKIYLHTDRSTYVAGNRIWFKAYLVDSKFHLLTNTSKVAYVELIDSQKQIVARRMLQLSKGMTTGDIKLPYTFPKGMYVLRAYTRYMQNFDQVYFFNKQIQILAPSIASTQLTTKQSPIANQSKTTPSLVQNQVRSSIDVQFFPEGGHLIDKMANYMAFKAVDNTGKGIRVQGKITDKKGKLITSFKSKKFGLGKVIFKPKKNQQYTAVINYQNHIYRFPLPKVQAQGFILHVKSTKDYFQIFVQASRKKQLTRSALVAHIRGYIIHQYIHQKTQPYYSLRIPKKNLPSGIVHFTLLDDKQKPQCERLAFVESPEYLLNTSFSPNSVSYSTRSKASFNIQIKDKEGNPVEGNVSLAVVHNNHEISQKQKMNIQNYLWLSSDLQGYIEHPAYYFNLANQGRHNLMDLLLMTQGWRRFKLQNDLEQVLEHDYEKGFTISGTLYKLHNRHKSIPGKVKLNLLRNMAETQSVTTDNQGHFVFRNLTWTDTVNVILQANKLTKRHKQINKKPKTRNDAIFIQPNLENTPQVTIPMRYFQAPNSIDKEREFKQLTREKNIRSITSAYGLEPGIQMLEEVQVSARKIHQKIKKLPGQDYFSPIHRIDFTTALKDEFTKKNAITYIRNKFHRHFGSKVRRTRVIFALDGFQASYSVIYSLTLDQIAYIDFLSPVSSMRYGGGTRNRVIAIYTKQGINLKGNQSTKERWGIINFQHPGYYKAREFYVPKHSQKTSKLPDYRRILYWNPSVNISQGKAQVDFFTSDEVAQYRIEIEGLTLDGQVILGEYQFVVKNQK